MLRRQLGLGAADSGRCSEFKPLLHELRGIDGSRFGVLAA
jgi:hypothetical protein